ncbi:transcription factor bHLH51-like [Apium graveolens]|uniref:transcription factor bHLH51-like n=1 Tax=Apium graveolens TaxID=4045 RepID=UPI003D7BB867
MDIYNWGEEAAATEAWHHPESQVAAQLNQDLGSTSFPCTSCLPLDDSNIHMHAYNSLSQLPTSFQGLEQDRSAASKSHSQAEKRRRDRINAQLATLRKLIPKSDKMDKAALLGSAVEHLKELKRKTLEASKHITIPTGIDEVTITEYRSDHEAGSTTSNATFIRVSICCENRPELFGELSHAIESLRLRMIQADMCCLGGRIKSCFVVCTKDSEILNGAADANAIKQSLKLVLSRVVTSSSTCTNYPAKSKRQRFFFPPYFSQ